MSKFKIKKPTKEDLFGADRVERILTYYRRNKSVRDTEDERLLHSFFNPSRIPEGLTRVQVRVCILLAPLRDHERSLQIDYEGIYSAANNLRLLPHELLLTQVYPNGFDEFNLGFLTFVIELATYDNACSQKRRKPQRRPMPIAK